MFILAAQEPDQPGAPTTTVDGNYVVIDWTAPNDQGSAIYSYIILIGKSDGVTFATESSDCDGNDATIVATTQCSIPISTLRASAFQLPWGSYIEAKIIAINAYGNSAESPVGNGA